MCCSYLVSMAWGGALAGLPSLVQPKVRLPWRSPFRASVRWIFVGLSGETGLIGIQNQSDRISWRRCEKPSTMYMWRARVAPRFSVNTHLMLRGQDRPASIHHVRRHARANPCGRGFTRRVCAGGPGFVRVRKWKAIKAASPSMQVGSIYSIPLAADVFLRGSGGGLFNHSI